MLPAEGARVFSGTFPVFFRDEHLAYANWLKILNWDFKNISIEAEELSIWNLFKRWALYYIPSPIFFFIFLGVGRRKWLHLWGHFDTLNLWNPSAEWNKVSFLSPLWMGWEGDLTQKRIFTLIFHTYRLQRLGPTSLHTYSYLITYIFSLFCLGKATFLSCSIKWKGNFRRSNLHPLASINVQPLEKTDQKRKKYDIK